MKIGYLITRMDEYGGAQVHVRDLAMWMKQKGHEVVVYSGAPGVVSDELIAAGIEYHEIPSLHRSIHPLKDYRAVRECVRALRDTRPDILTCHSSKAGIVGRIAARLAGIPSVFTAHNWTFRRGAPLAFRPVYWAMEWAGARFGDHCITVSEFGRRQALCAKIAKPDNITAINNGMPDITPVKRDETTTGPVRITMIARIGWPKDHVLLINALSKLKAQPWILNLVGGGDDGALRALAKACGIEDRVNFMGERRDIADILGNTDLFVLTSTWEGFPLSILEAMRAGLPVIASDVGGVRESVHDGENGFCVAASDIAALQSALETLVQNAPMRARMGRKGREMFENHFLFEDMAAKTLAVYERVLAR
jgi:glycosyltransferase involved in cell wall biosynthesis